MASVAHTYTNYATLLFSIVNPFLRQSIYFGVLFYYLSVSSLPYQYNLAADYTIRIFPQIMFCRIEGILDSLRQENGMMLSQNSSFVSDTNPAV